MSEPEVIVVKVEPPEEDVVALNHKRTRLSDPSSTRNSESPVPSKKSKVDKTPTLAIQGSPIKVNDHPSIEQEMEMIRLNQDAIIQKQNDMTMTIFRLEKKIDYLISLVERKNTVAEDPCNEVLNILPVSEERFLEFEEKLSSSSALRNQLKKILVSCYGRDCKGYIANCLRRVISDELACRYSLTGRNKTGVEKLCFESTTTYMLLREACLETFEDVKNNILRDTVSEWLIQAKFRIARREKSHLEKVTSEFILP